MGIPGRARPCVLPSVARPAAVERQVAAMGTVLRVSVAGLGRRAALAASEAAVREVARVEALLSTWRRGGSLDRLNRAGLGTPVDIGAETADLLKSVHEWSLRTGRAFDPTVLPLVEAWDLRGQGRIPIAADLARAMAATGPDGFSVDPVHGSARRVSAGAEIDEGAWGKGYALDRAAAALRASGVSEAVLDLGGQVLLLGQRRIAVADPRDRAQTAVSLRCADVSVSTSGDSERSRTVGGRRIGHLLDPRTGQPAVDFGSATAVAPSGLVADILSTAFFVLGPEQGLVLSEKLRRDGFANEALFVIVDGGGLKTAASPGLNVRLSEALP